MSDASRRRRALAALGMLAAALAVAASVAVRPGLAAQVGAGSPGPHADSCGLNDPAGRTVVEQPTLEVYRPGEYPVQLPAVSLLGAPNDLPNPYEAGVHWGALPDGRHWGSTAGITTGPDNTIWAIDRCGLRGTGGTLCLESDLDPILQFDTAGQLLNSFGRGTIVSPHKITVDQDGNVWIADNGAAPGRGHQVLKFNPSGELIMTLGTAGMAGDDLDHFDAPTARTTGSRSSTPTATSSTSGSSSAGRAASTSTPTTCSTSPTPNRGTPAPISGGR